uniref:NADH-ubiquinone oxidoreductase chain 3 n=1 Tax=Physaloptera rara TaxID=2358290 RepID=A0A4Y6I4R2_9BILA|nr:NADH dehydrogenase subunit 3 [Physaloptera rara]
MIFVWYVAGLSLLILLGMYSASFFLSFKESGGKLSMYECGFDAVSGGHLGFSVYFFVVVLVFVVFELEIIMFILVIYSSFYNMLLFLFVFFYVLLSFFMEWYFDKLNWGL